MSYDHGAFPWPWRRGDYYLVDTTREGTYWQSPDGVVVRLASAEADGIDAGDFAEYGSKAAISGAVRGTPNR